MGRALGRSEIIVECVRHIRFALLEHSPVPLRAGGTTLSLPISQVRLVPDVPTARPLRRQVVRTDPIPPLSLPPPTPSLDDGQTRAGPTKTLPMLGVVPGLLEQAVQHAPDRRVVVVPSASADEHPHACDDSCRTSPTLISGALAR